MKKLLLNRYTSLLLLCIGFASTATVAQTLSEFVDVEVGDDITCGLRLDGSLSCPVRFIIPRFELPDDMPSVVDVSVGSNFACAVQSDGFLRCWGDDGLGQLQAPTSGAPYQSVSAGGVHACAINAASEIECWGASNSNRLAAPEGAFVALSASEQDTCALTGDGSVRCWGINDIGTSSPPADLPAARQVVSGRSASCALLLDGSVQCWGLSFPLPDGGPFTEIDMTVNGVPADGANSEFCGLGMNGKIHCSFIDSSSGNTYQSVQDKIPDTEGFTSIGVNGLNVCAVNSTGLVECWGFYDDVPIPGEEVGELPFGATTGLRAEIYSATTVELFWDFPETLHQGFAGHEIVRDGEIHAFTPNASSYLDTEVPTGRSVNYSVRRIQVDGSKGDLSETIMVDTASGVSDSPGTDNYQVPERPFKPKGLSATVYGTHALELFWDRADTFELLGYEVHRDGEYLAFTAGVSFVDNVPETNRVYRYDVIPISRFQSAFQGVSGIDVGLGEADAGACR